MPLKTGDDQDLTQMLDALGRSGELEQVIRPIVRDEMDRHMLGLSEPRSQAQVAASMQRLKELRKKIALRPDEVDAILEEHRREFGRG